jgi:hypothetical protein
MVSASGDTVHEVSDILQGMCHVLTVFTFTDSVCNSSTVSLHMF